MEDAPTLANFCTRVRLLPDDFGNGPLWLFLPLTAPHNTPSPPEPVLQAQQR
jgi:hypothetical protein